MIGIDLDGTLLTPEKTITPETVAALEEASRAGIEIVPTTGRPFFGLPAELLKISGIRYVITSNGAVTYQLPERKMINAAPLTKEICVAIYDLIAPYASIFEAFMDGYGYESQISYDNLLERFRGHVIVEYFKQSRRAVPDLREYMLQTDSPVNELSVMCDTQEDCASIKKLLQSYEDICVIENEANELEIYHVKAGKGNALMQLGKKLGIPPEFIAVIGDGTNDLDMFRQAAFSIAMENATSEIKQLASASTRSNAEDGVAWAIRTYFLKHKEWTDYEVSG